MVFRDPDEYFMTPQVNITVIVLKFQTINYCWLSGLEFTKMLVKIVNREEPDQTAL